MARTNRREFLTLAGGVAAAAVVGTQGETARGAVPATHESFSFLFLTDTHIQPELDAAKGCDMAFKKARGIKADFAIQGGDHVMDTEEVTRERAKSIYSLYGDTEQVLGLKVHHTCGNHDCFGIAQKGQISESDPEYGKKMFEEHFGPVYYSFDHKGVHFLVLESVKPNADSSGYTGNVDEKQLAWIASDLDKLAAGTPVIASIHIPLVTALDSYGPIPEDHRSSRGGSSVANSDEVVTIFDKHNVIGVLQGHTHVWEQVEWHGVRYVTGGAVCGNWWKGSHKGTAEGFTVVNVADGKMNVRYETYGFQSVDRHDN